MTEEQKKIIFVNEHTGLVPWEVGSQYASHNLPCAPFVFIDYKYI